MPDVAPRYDSSLGAEAARPGAPWVSRCSHPAPNAVSWRNDLSVLAPRELLLPFHYYLGLTPRAKLQARPAAHPKIIPRS